MSGTGITFPHGRPGLSKTVQVTGNGRTSNTFGARSLTKPFGPPIKKLPVTPSSSADDDSDPENCTVCARQRTTVFCIVCGFERNNLRVRKPCERHAKVHFVGDLTVCPRCRTANLEEESDEMK